MRSGKTTHAPTSAEDTWEVKSQSRGLMMQPQRAPERGAGIILFCAHEFVLLLGSNSAKIKEQLDQSSMHKKRQICRMSDNSRKHGLPCLTFFAGCNKLARPSILAVCPCIVILTLTPVEDLVKIGEIGYLDNISIKEGFRHYKVPAQGWEGNMLDLPPFGFQLLSMTLRLRGVSQQRRQWSVKVSQFSEKRLETFFFRCPVHLGEVTHSVYVEGRKEANT